MATWNSLPRSPASSGIADGDTLTARCELPEGKANITVRVAEIDAPEKGQAWGQRSRQHLAALCHSRPAVVRPQTTDRYGRTVARVECDGSDASAEQVRAGLAWVFDRYVRDRSLYAVQEEARDERRGLWADHEPVPPWEWRRAR
jgi:endonuclease YncB( thermonuclease family)